ncbi:TIGR02221 family CRISPR-associated protein [Roseiflexus sp.]
MTDGIKAITFLGLRPGDTCYVFPDGREHTAPFFGIALAEYMPRLRMRVFVTEAARHSYEERFLPRVQPCVADVSPVMIPDGRNSEELWQIFQQVVDAIEANETVIFDLTHGFRSLPFLSFLAVAYLRKVKDINLQGVYFGNFDAGDKSVSPPRTPVVDLTLFAELLDWTVAADLFVRFGDARDLADLLKKQHNRIKPDPRNADKAEMSAWNNLPVKTVASQLYNITQALRLVRPADALDSSAQIRDQLRVAIQSINALVQPFTLLTDKVLESFSPLALSRADQQNDPVRTLQTERDLIMWYLDRNQTFQAVALAREWLVSWVMVQLGRGGQILEKQEREQVECALGAAAQQRRRKAAEAEKAADDRRMSIDLRTIPSNEEVVKLFEQLGDLRNDLMHAGKRKESRSARMVEQQIQKLREQIASLSIS